jgi:hypothetical protein
MKFILIFQLLFLSSQQLHAKNRDLYLFSTSKTTEVVNDRIIDRFKTVRGYYNFLSKSTTNKADKHKYEILAKKAPDVPMPKLQFVKENVLTIKVNNLKEKIVLDLKNKIIIVGNSKVNFSGKLSGPDFYADISLRVYQALSGNKRKPEKTSSIFDLMIEDAHADSTADPFVLWREVLEEMPDDRRDWTDDQNRLFDMGKGAVLLSGMGIGATLGLAAGELAGSAISSRLLLASTGGLIGGVLAGVFFPTPAHAATIPQTRYQCNQDFSGGFEVFYDGGVTMRVSSSQGIPTRIEFTSGNQRVVSCPVSQSSQGPTLLCDNRRFLRGVEPTEIGILLQGANAFASFCSDPNRSEYAGALSQIMNQQAPGIENIQIYAPSETSQ